MKFLAGLAFGVVLGAATVEILRRLRKIMALLDTLTADVAANATVIGSAVTLLQGLKAQLDAAGTDPAKLADLSAQLEAQTKALSDAVTANTPAAPAPTP